ncbi:MAG: hypothetical protein EOP06_21540, partial [Proteobacteria bacterium]
EGEVIQHSMMTKSIERAQKKVEENNFGVRKRLLEYDDVMNSQREVVYKRRKPALHGERLKLDIANMMYDTSEVIAEQNKQTKDFKNFEFELIRYFSITSPVTESEFEKLSEIELAGKVYKAAMAYYAEKTERSAREAFPIIKNVFEQPNNQFERIVVPFTDGVKTLNVVTDLPKAYQSEGRQLIADFEKNITLAIVDEAWKKHLRKMDELKQSVQLAVHEQKDPLLIYKFEAFKLFKNLIDNVNKEVISFLFKGDLPQQQTPQIQEASELPRPKENYKTTKEDIDTDDMAQEAREAGQTQPRNVTETIVREMPKINRNDTVTVLNYNVRQYQTNNGAVLFDTLSYISVHHYKEIAGVYIFRNRGWGQRRIASVLMAGGAGYFILNVVNTAYRKEDMGSKENLTTLAGSAVAFGAGWLLKRNAPSGFTGKRYEIKYMNMQ